MFRSYLGQQGSLADLESTPLMEFEVKNIANFFFFTKKQFITIVPYKAANLDANFTVVSHHLSEVVNHNPE